jgi:hypothetical protein
MGSQFVIYPSVKRRGSELPAVAYFHGWKFPALRHSADCQGVTVEHLGGLQETD